MNKIHLAVSGISFFVLIVLFSNCHKSGSPAPSQGDSSCLVASIYYGDNGNSTTTYNYDDQNRLISWNQNTKPNSGTTIAGQTFRYGPGYILVNMITGTDTSAIPDSLVLNSDGTVSEHYQAWTQTGGTLWKYTYASNGEVQQRTQSYPHQSPPYTHTTVFTWSNGDLMYNSDGERYTYDTTRKVAPGDQWMITMLNEYGNMAYTIKNTHMQTSADGVKFTYIYDAWGKVISYGNTATSLVTYTCP